MLPHNHPLFNAMSALKCDRTIAQQYMREFDIIDRAVGELIGIARNAVIDKEQAQRRLLREMEWTNLHVSGNKALELDLRKARKTIRTLAWIIAVAGGFILAVAVTAAIEGVVR